LVQADNSIGNRRSTDMAHIAGFTADS
jgi:hypothetical protein